MAQVSDYTALLSGYSWSGSASEMNSPAFVTYSFDTSVAPYLTNNDFTKAFRDSFVAFTAAEKNAARTALAQWGDASGLVFLEVPAGQGDIRFGTYDFSLDPATSGFTGYGYYPSTAIDKYYAYRTEIGGDVFIDHGAADDVYLLLHEIGHAVGFKHPFEGQPTLAPNLDNHSHTIMSYTGSYPDTLGPFDLDAVKAVYGNASADGTQVASWSWKEASHKLIQKGYDGRDTIFGVSVKDVINGGGGNDRIAGFQGKDIINGGTGNDRIFGGEQADRLRGGGGFDYLQGDEGNDRFDFTRTDLGRDVIADFASEAGNRDRLFFAEDAFGSLGRKADGTGTLDAMYFQATATSDAQTVDVRFSYDTWTGVLRYDPDGNGAMASTVIAKLWGLPDLTNADLVIF